ncbi:hypothetical protein AArcSl_1988 [Halalkaliarchaeum desulfuricum]|uniref:DUF8131 domain-containing protein n=1 Tax=Halalkaliarchaeum desulfuricum TaxID=2055893 RepID=A0A343TKJ1_9EURY|nr:cytochrome-ba3 oxidase subunit [Halalkaliarchaeum desulfuricum]AUX09613.1 hypothetical protein AArcSl_1988 [Halalkaliarchaeum desulfuricum]
MDLSPRQVVLLGLAALVPGAIYTIGTGEYIAAIALVNIVLIVGCLVLAMSDTEPPESGQSNGSPIGQ